MSSIYKKGRDGYYYYQTYVFNPRTKKKIKIFHALGTKDIQIAKKKQVEYDRKYKNKIIKTSERISNKRILLLFIFVLIIFFGIYLKI